MEKLESAEFVCVFVGSDYLYLYVCVYLTKEAVCSSSRQVYVHSNLWDR